MNPDSTSDGDEGVTRRTFLRTTAGAATTGGAAVASTGEAEAQTQTYRFGGEVVAWHGRAPPRIEGEDNPSVELQAGKEYEFWFENVDGAPHNMTIQDAEGNNIVKSKLVTNEGGTASVTFTATSAMAQYICTIHPTTMVGDVNVVGEVQGGQGGGGGIPVVPAAYAGAVVLAFLSPLFFALFLFSRRREGEGETTTG